MIKAMLVKLVFLGIMLLHSNTAYGTQYTVGDEAGWIYNVAGWEDGKSFKAGDTLLFKYGKGLHTVVVVDKSSYDSCTVPPNAPTYTSGNDEITLNKGENYFICGVGEHCDLGMKIAANAS